MFLRNAAHSILAFLKLKQGNHIILHALDDMTWVALFSGVFAYIANSAMYVPPSGSNVTFSDSFYLSPAKPAHGEKEGDATPEA